MKKVLIISPSFPPINAADMHRVRMSLPYMKSNGWIPIVVTVRPDYNENIQDSFLEKSIPHDIEVIKIGALSTTWTRKIGLGSLALRSFAFYWFEVNKLLKHRQVDLIYFSTTMFPLFWLGQYWKKKYGVPYVLDMQDLWLTDHYDKIPKHERPPKYWFSKLINRYLEPRSIPETSGIISVSPVYIQTMKQRYLSLNKVPSITLPFGVHALDFEIAKELELTVKITGNRDVFNIIYIGRGGTDMHTSLQLIFEGFKEGLRLNFGLFDTIRFTFIGTSYAKSGIGIQTIFPLAEKMNIQKYVSENTDRLPYYQVLRMLQIADALLIPGSDDPAYSASKIGPYIYVQKPLLAVFHEKSPAIEILKPHSFIELQTFNPEKPINNSYSLIREKIHRLMEGKYNLTLDTNTILTSEKMTKQQCDFFSRVLINEKNVNV